jgi:hypothetical protein
VPPRYPAPDLNQAIQQLFRHSQTCLQAVTQDDWPLALEAMADRQPWLDALEAATPLPTTVTQLPVFAQWQHVEQQLQQAMAGLNDKQVQLEQVFAQIQSARQHLYAYQINPDKQQPNQLFTQSVEG